MERLTRRINGVVVYVGAKNPYSTGQIPCEVEPAGVREMMDRLAAYEDTRLTPEEIDMDHEAAEQLRQLCQGCDLDRLEELAEADKDGRLVVLPCKVGDTLWVARNPWTGELLKKPLDAYVNGMKMYSHGLYVNLLFDTRKINGTRDYEINHICKTVFITREAAEKALEATMDGGADNG